jgi:carbon storage regulator
MLVLSRQRDQAIIIGNDIEITILEVRGDKVRIGISAPKNVTVHRKEVYEEICKANEEASQMKPGDLPPGKPEVKPPPKPADDESADGNK